MTNVEKFITALVTPNQTLEDTLQQMYSERRIDTAVGAQLTLIGKLVGAPREGITDDEIYRRRVRAAIATNKSDGLIEDILTIADLVVYDDDAVYLIENQGAAAFVLRINGIVVAAAVVPTLLKYLRRAVAGGVRIIIELMTGTEAESFTFDHTTPLGGSGLGFGDTLDGGTGGKLISAME